MRGHLPIRDPLNPIGLRSIHHCLARIGQSSQANHPDAVSIARSLGGGHAFQATVQPGWCVLLHHVLEDDSP